MINHRASEVERLLRLNHRAMGRLEALVLGRATEQVGATHVDATLDRVASALRDHAATVKTAADAGVPGPPD